jgi:DNA-binding transcriptional LysR family regulator
MHVLLYAAPQYLNKFGTPQSIDDLKDHRLVWQDARLAVSEITRQAVDIEMLAQAAAVTTNTSTAHFWSIAKGAGIGFLPTYVSAIARGLVPVDIGLRIEGDIYLVTKKSPANAETVELISTWIKQVFRPGDHPWFAQEFADPKTFVKNASSEVVVDLFKPRLNEWVSSK